MPAVVPEAVTARTMTGAEQSPATSDCGLEANWSWSAAGAQGTVEQSESAHPTCESQSASTPARHTSLAPGWTEASLSSQSLPPPTVDANPSRSWSEANGGGVRWSTTSASGEN